MKIDKNIDRLELNERGYLRPLTESDITDLYVEGLNDPQVNRFLIGPRSQHQTVESVTDFVRMNRESSTDILFGLFVGEVLSGTLRLHDATATEVYLGLALFNRNVWGQGWGRAMISGARNYACSELGLKTIKAGIEAENVVSQMAFSDCDFTHVESRDYWLGEIHVQVWEYSVRSTTQGNG